jgi:hypothetical protein
MRIKGGSETNATKGLKGVRDIYVLSAIKRSETFMFYMKAWQGKVK